MSSELLRFSNGQKVPVVGLGTWRPMSEEEVTTFKNGLRVALDLGYRHIDTASSYGNEEYVGQVLQEYISAGKLKREDVFVTSKLWPGFNERHRVPVCLDDSLKNLQLKFVDLYLVHFPGAIKDLPLVDGKRQPPEIQNVPIEETWKAMEQLYKDGKAKSIGLSNFNMEQVGRIYNAAEIKPVTNQIECHVYLQQPKMFQFLKERGMVLTAYSPLASPDRLQEGDPKCLEDAVAKDVAAKHDKTVAQILLRFLIQKGAIVIPKSSHAGRLKENLEVLSFTLGDDDMQRLSSLDKQRRFNPVSRFSEHPEYPFHEEL